MSDHRHEAHDIYGGAATSGELGYLRSQVDGLRYDLAAAESRIRDLETRVTELRDRLWDHEHSGGVISGA